MDKLRKCYEALGIMPGASWEEIRQAYKDAIKVWHPDRFENDPRLREKAQEKIKEINAAYEKLSSFFREYGAPNFAKSHGRPSQEPPNDPYKESPIEPEEPVRDEPDHEFNKAIWNPNAAANWSLAFTPAFGSYLQMVNWQTLGKPDKASTAKNWFYVSIAILAIYIFIGVVVDNPKTSDDLAKVIGFFYLIIWYFAFARSQGKYVKEKFGANYPRKSWGKPLLVGTVACIIYFIAALLVGLTSELSHNQTAVPAPVPAPTPATALVNNEVNNYIKPNSVKFIVQDNCDDAISIQYRFFDTKNNLWWPSSDRVYRTSQYMVPNLHELSCTPGTTICFGATTYTSSPTVSWGLGVNNDIIASTTDSCVVCGEVAEKSLNFACPPKKEYTNQTHNNTTTDNARNLEKIDNIIDFQNKRQQQSSKRNSYTVNTTAPDSEAYYQNKIETIEPKTQAEKKVIELSDLTPSQRQSVEFACFDARAKGQLQFDNCIKSKLSAYK